MARGVSGDDWAQEGVVLRITPKEVWTTPDRVCKWSRYSVGVVTAGLDYRGGLTASTKPKNLFDTGFEASYPVSRIQQVRKIGQLI